MNINVDEFFYEEPVFKSTETNLPVDMFVVYENHAAVYEAKIGCSRVCV